MNLTPQEIFRQQGKTVPLGPNRTILPGSGIRLYLVAGGQVDFYAVPLAADTVSGARRFVCSFNPGELFLSCALHHNDGTGTGFVVAGTSTTSLREMAFQDFLDEAVKADAMETVAELIDTFVSVISAALPATDYPRQLQVDLTEMKSSSKKIGHGENCSCRAGISWIGVTTGSLSFRNGRHHLLPASGMFPLAPATWATAIEDSELIVTATSAMLAENKLDLAAENFLTTVLSIIAADEQARGSNDLQRLHNRKKLDAAAVQDSLARFAQLLSPEQDRGGVHSANPLINVFAMVCNHLGMPHEHSRYGELSPDDSYEDQLQIIAGAAGVRSRKVTLEDGWWKKDCGHLIAFARDDAYPIALINLPGGGYRAYNPVTDETVLVNDTNASQFRYFAYMLYRSFPDRIINGTSLFSFGMLGIERDLGMVIIMGLCGSILSLTVPIVSGIVFDTVIPQAQRNQMWLLCLALMMCAIGATVFDLTKRIAVLRIESRMDLHIQGAVWDRLLKLPPPFFREYSSGDLADRAMGISAIRQAFSDTIAESLLAAVFSISSLALLFYYSYHLALIAIAIAVIAVIIITILGFIQGHYQKKIAGQRGTLSSKVLELVTCIAKFRIAGAENRAFSGWAEAFFSQQNNVVKARYTANIIKVFSEVFPILISMVIFWSIISLSRTTPLSIGSFLAFSAAFTQFISTLMALSMSIVSISGIIPYFERCKPIIETLPERDSAKEQPGRLKGNLEVNGVTFRYSDATPLVLADVHLKALPGEFIAIVGPSGSGKSTLARLLLGFEKPDTGCIFYDGKDLERLDVHQIRRQIGVVLQNGKLIAGEIFSNIVGSLNQTIEHAWEAARMAGLEEDIKNMPMGMHTFISEGGGNISGGQQQRLLIARALISKPAILIFDEATSALDNRTQAIVNESLASLRVTRVVIAHRLSTIINADRIYVLEKGRIVERGGYDELMKLNGVFTGLAKRQVT